MNACLEMRYILSDLAGNAWCRDANALLAACNLATRRGNPPPDALRQQFQQINRSLKEILQGRMKVPQVDESLEMTPTVTNFDTDMGRGRTTARRA